MPKRTNTQSLIRKIAVCGIFTAMASVLMFLEFSIPFIPLVKFDFSELPILIGSFSLGPVYGVIMELLKNLIHLPQSSTSGIGELSNFIIGSIYVFVAGSFYEHRRSRRGAIVSLILSAAAIAVIAIPFNKFITLPLYGSVLGYSLDQIIGMCSLANPLIKDEFSLLLYVFVPINLIKGIVIGFISYFVYKPVSNLINSTYKRTRA